MTMPPALRKFALVAHVVASVGWLGAVATALVLAIAGLASQDGGTVRAAYIALEPIAWYALVPLAFASLLTGLVQSLGSEWGLFRHYWVVAKLLINLAATIVLLAYMQTLGSLADLAAETTVAGGDLGVLRSASPVLHAAGALVLLLLATVLAVYKPRGMTSYGRRRQRERPARTTR
jgi:hypothetical protein